MLDEYISFVVERDKIRIKKAMGMPAPWTEDPILQKYKFCNMRRRDDRVSKWIIDEIIEPYKQSRHLWFMLAIARVINWPPTLAMLMDRRDCWPTQRYDAGSLGAAIDKRQGSCQKTWTSAYMVNSSTNPPGIGKGTYYAKGALQKLYDRRKEFMDFFAMEDKTIKGAMGLFAGAFNFGTFMAGQVVADWTYSPLLADASDLYTYAPRGPGSMRGANILLGRKPHSPLKEQEFLDALIMARNELIARHPSFSDCTLHDTQNQFCEFQKYHKIKTTEGKIIGRQLYTTEMRF